MKLRTQVAPLLGETRHADDKVLVVLRMLLSIQQRFLVDDVELDVMAVHVKVAAHQVGQVLDTLVAGNGAWRELLVEQGAACCRVVHLGARLDNYR